MAITLSQAYIDELKKGFNSPNVIIELHLDTGTKKYGQSSGGFIDVQPVLKSVSSLQNKIDAKAGYTTRGILKFTISGRDTIKTLINGEYLNNRRVVRYDGFYNPDPFDLLTEAEEFILTESSEHLISESGFSYGDYAAIFKGKIKDWSRKGDELTITVADDMVDGIKNIPDENARNTQTINYQNTNPVDIMTDILSTQMGISTAYIDSTQFASEKSLWMNNFYFDRVLTDPKSADQYLNELQIETNSFIVHDGQKVSYKVFAPIVPGQTLQGWDDNNNILDNSLSQESGYNDRLHNRIVVMYDYDESGSEGIKNYESIYIAQDSSSLSASEWDETNSHIIKSKWIRTRTIAQPSNISGVTVYHVSRDNGVGDGTLTFSTGSTANSLQWKAPGGTIGSAVTINNSGAFQLFDSDTSKSVRVIVESSSLPASSTNETLSITSLNGDGYVSALALRHLARYRDPVSTIKFSLDMNDGVYNSNYLKPTDLKEITSDEAFDITSTSWTSEQMMLTAIRPNVNQNTINVEAIQTKLYKNYGFIAPAGYPDYSSATDAQKEYAFIANSSGELSGSTSLAYYIW